MGSILSARHRNTQREREGKKKRDSARMKKNYEKELYVQLLLVSIPLVCLLGYKLRLLCWIVVRSSIQEGIWVVCRVTCVIFIKSVILQVYNKILIFSQNAHSSWDWLTATKLPMRKTIVFSSPSVLSQRDDNASIDDVKICTSNFRRQTRVVIGCVGALKIFEKPVCSSCQPRKNCLWKRKWWSNSNSS